MVFGSQPENLSIVDTLQIAALVYREDIVTQFSELVGDHPAGDMRVEE